MDASFTANPANLFAFPGSVDFGYKNNNFQYFDYNNLSGFDNGSYPLNGELFPDSNGLFSYQHDNMNSDLNNTVSVGMNQVNVMNDTMNSVSSANAVINDVTNTGLNSTSSDENKCFDNYYNSMYFAPGNYYNSQAETTKFNLGDLSSADQFNNYEQSFNQFKNQNMTETSLIEPGITIGDVNSDKSSNSPNYSFQPNYPFDSFNSYPYYCYAPVAQDNSAAVNNYVTDLNDSTYLPLNLDDLSNKDSSKDELESVANASTCDNTPVLQPANPKFSLNTLSSNFNQTLNSMNFNGMSNGFTDMSSASLNNTINLNGMADMNNTLNSLSGLNSEAFAQDLSDTQLVNSGFYYPNYYQYFYNPNLNAGNVDVYDAAFDNVHFDEGLNESIIEIANEIANNVQYLPDKDSNGKYSLDKNHPIHCVWRDVNRGHCSWRCRWWENGKRLSKNFNVKRFGDFEAMRMAITMKIRNSTPVERIQLLKEQREAVRNQMQLYNYYPSNYNFNYLTNFSDRKITKVMNNSKKLQRENWNRLSWTYLKTSKLENSTDSTIICRLCSKTTRCSRSRNLQQAHIMHLIRMHKNPWKQYIDPNGLTKMCKLALDSLYEQNRFRDNQEWNLRPGVQRPEPYFL